MRFRRKTFRRRRRLRSDVVPVSICRQDLQVTDDPAGTCDSPLAYLFPLVDGGSLDAALRHASAGDEVTTQGLTKGLIYGGGQLNAYWSYVGDPVHGDGSLPGPLQAIIGIWQALVVVETYFDTGLNARAPTYTPNLLSKDEQITGDIVHRWYDRILMLSAGTGGPNPQIVASDNTGMCSIVYCATNEPSCFQFPGSGCNTQRKQVIKTKRRLKENQALYYCVNLVLGFVPSQPFQLGFDLYGFSAVRALR